MSKIFVDQVDPKTATTLTLGTSGDTVSIPSGVTLANAGTVTGLPASAISSGTIATARLGYRNCKFKYFFKRRSNVRMQQYAGNYVNLANVSTRTPVASVLITLLVFLINLNIHFINDMVGFRY